MNWELERNFVDPNSSTGDKFGVGVTGSTSTSLNHSVGGIILAGGSSICASNILKIQWVHVLRLPAQIVVVGRRRYCGSRNFVFLDSSMMYLSSCLRPSTGTGSDFLGLFQVFSDDKSFNLLFDSFHTRLQHSAQLLSILQN